MIAISNFDDLPIKYSRIVINDPNKLLLPRLDIHKAIIFRWRNDWIEVMRKAPFPIFNFDPVLIDRLEMNRWMENLQDKYQIFRHKYNGGKQRHLIGQQGEKFVIKCGNDHAGNGKFVVKAGQRFDTSSYRWYTVEPFIEGRSVRVLLFRISGKVKHYTIEHINSQNEIKNIDPEQELVGVKVPKRVIDYSYSLFEKFPHLHVLGVDFQIGPKKLFSKQVIKLLELNIFPGYPEENKEIKADYDTVIGEFLEKV